MTDATVARAVLCEDDAVMRGVIRRMLEDLGVEVVDEASEASDAIDATRRTGADLVVVDLALEGGSGEDVLAALAGAPHTTEIIVFSAFVDSVDALRKAGAAAVVEKPDFVQLEEVLIELLSARTGDRRRRPERPVADLPALGVTTGGGFETWRSFGAAIPRMTPGDALLVLDLVPGEGDQRTWDHVHRYDHLVALGRLAAASRRAGERVSLSPEGLPTIAVVGGHREAPAAVFGRLQQAWKDGSPAGVPIGVCGYVSEDWPPVQLLELMLEAVQDGADPGHPLRMV